MTHDGANALVFGAVGCGIAAIGSMVFFITSPTYFSAGLMLVSLIVLIAFSINALSTAR